MRKVKALLLTMLVLLVTGAAMADGVDPKVVITTAATGTSSAGSPYSVTSFLFPTHLDYWSHTYQTSVDLGQVTSFYINNTGVTFTNLLITATPGLSGQTNQNFADYVCQLGGGVFSNCSVTQDAAHLYFFAWGGPGLAPGQKINLYGGPYDVTNPQQLYWKDPTSFTVKANVPEPASFLLLGSGLLGLGGLVRRRIR